jgi:hypothetical protein
VVFSDIYGTEIDTELGTEDRTQRFTTLLRKRYANEGQRVFNERTGCFVKRVAIALVDATQEYDLESASVISAADYLRPSKTSATLKKVDAATNTSYAEGPELTFIEEESLNQTRPNWRAESPGTPEHWTFREDTGAQYLVLIPAPDVPAGDTWTLLWPYVAQPADMTDDSHEPWGNASPRTTLRPYHRACVHYATAQLEKLRKDWQAVERQMKLFAGQIAAYHDDMAKGRRPNGQTLRIAHDYRRRFRGARPRDPRVWA